MLHVARNYFIPFFPNVTTAKTFDGKNAKNWRGR